MRRFKDMYEGSAVSKIEWPTSKEVSGRFLLVIIVLIVLTAIIASTDGLLRYLLGFIY